jgi:hypothetical protein
LFQQLLSAVKAKGLKQELHGLMAGVVHGAAAAAYADAVKKQSAVERPACRIPAGTRGRRGEL